MKDYLHKIDYYKYKDILVGLIPSLDYAFFLPNNELAKLPSSILSKEKPLFHKSYNRLSRVKRVIVLTNGCNLQCKYCFEGKEHLYQSMTSNDVKNIIIEMFEEAKKLNKKLISFSLFGGEPTLNWEGVISAINITNKLEEETGIKCYKAIITNGAMSEEKAKYIGDNFDFVYISFDGPKELFLKQRQPRGGSQIYQRIFNNAILIYKTNTYLSFKVTVTRYTIDYLKEIDDFFAYNFPTCSRLYQPCMVNKEDSLYISFDKFIEKYYELENYSIFRKNITNSLYKNKPSDRFCNLSIRNVVYPNGDVLACHRCNMDDPEDLVRKVFLKGTNVNGKIDLSYSKIAQLERFNIENIEKCNQCFLRYHCCGGCPVIKLLSGEDMFSQASYCEGVNKYFFSKILSRLLNETIPFIKKLPTKYEVKEDIQIDFKDLKIMANNLIRMEE